jgi:glucose/arabinose dehydrogenase
MASPARPSPTRPSRPTFRTVLVVLVIVASAVLAAVVATRARPFPVTVVDGPTGRPSGSIPVAGSRFDPRRVAVTLEPFASGLSNPLAIVAAGDGSGRLFVAEQGGRIRVIHDGSLEPTPFLDISAEIASGGERGLLGLAFHPRFPADPRVFVDYTDTNGDTHVSSFVVAPSGDRLDPGSESPILFVKQPFANHNGGALLFDPQGMLLVSLGDGGSGGDPQGNGQSLSTLLGKILRIDVEHSTAGQPYGIPADNPFASGAAGARPEIWLTGLRNPWRMSFDRATGDLWIGDVGQSAWEEVDVQRAGAPAGTNFGWNRMEGTHCFEPSTGCADASLRAPVTDYGHDLGCTVIGGGVYRGTAQPALVGGYVFGDYCSGRVWAIDPAGDAYRSPVEVAKTTRNLSAFGEDEAGDLFVADITGGAILRVTATSR